MILKSHSDFERYFLHLQEISFLGKTYKKYILSPILYFYARRFGSKLAEIGSGAGRGVLGQYPSCVRGLDINPMAVSYCQSQGLDAQLIGNDGIFPLLDGEMDCCILDNVLEHIDSPGLVLDECYRVTSAQGGLVIAVPGLRGFSLDPDHRKFYDTAALKQLDARWQLQSLFSTPFLFRSQLLSKVFRQYCLVAVYVKK